MYFTFFKILRNFLILWECFLLVASDKTASLPCRITKESSEICIVSKKGDYTVEDDFILLTKQPEEIKHIKIIRVKLGHLPISGLRPFTNLETLTLEGCSISSLDGFKELRTVQQIFLNQNHIMEIADRKFNPKIVYIEAQFNKIQNVTKNAFKNLHNLFWLDLSNNRIKKVPKKLFSRNKVLSSINLNNNRIRNINGLFNGLDKLKFLHLSKNRIVKLPINSFKSQTALRELDLSENRIQHVDPTSFKSCRNLRLLKLSKNQLKEFDFVMYFDSLAFLYVTDNNLKCFQMTAVDTVTLRAKLQIDISNTVNIANGLTSLTFKGNVPSVSFNAANNNLKNITSFSKLIRIEKLNLANNTELKTASLYSLSNLTMLKELNLEGIELGVEQLEDVLKIRNLKSLEMSRNTKLQETIPRLHGISPIQKLIIKNSNLTQLNVRRLSLIFPKLQEIDVTENKFGNATLKQAISEFKRFGVVIKSNSDFGIGLPKNSGTHQFNFG